MRARVAASVMWSALALASCGGSGSATATRASDSTGSGGSRTVTVTRTAPASSSASAAPSPGATTGSAMSGSGGAPLSGASATSAGGGPPPCRATGLALSFLGQQGATGHGELGFALRNVGNSSCATIGYPGIQFLDRFGGPLPTVPVHTTHDLFGASTLRGMVLAVGQGVSFRLGVTHGIGSGVGCTTAYGLQVIPPNDKASLRVTIADGAAECATATVSPLSPGNSAYP